VSAAGSSVAADCLRNRNRRFVGVPTARAE
jgi:hypothetical protein